MKNRLRIDGFLIDAVAAAMYVTGFAETVRDLLKVRSNFTQFSLITSEFVIGTRCQNLWICNRR